MLYKIWAKVKRTAIFSLYYSPTRNRAVSDSPRFIQKKYSPNSKKLSSTDVNIALVALKKIYAHSVKNYIGNFL